MAARAEAAVIAETPPVNPADVPALIAALMAEGASREKATTIALHVRTVLWPTMAAANAPRKATG